MRRRQRRMLTVAAILTGVVLAAVLAMQAFEDNLLYFYSPTEMLSGEMPSGKTLRLGGMVEDGSVARDVGELEVRFAVTDYQNTVIVRYAGVLPDLFREGQGIIATGSFHSDGTFVAEEVLAKHDENYMPPEVADMLEEQGHTPDTTSL